MLSRRPKNFAFATLGLLIAAAGGGCSDTAEAPPLSAGQHEHYHVHSVDVVHDHDHGGAERGGHAHSHGHPGAGKFAEPVGDDEE